MASLRLDDQLCFGLYSASRAVTSLYRVVLDDLDLTYPQYLVMLALWEQDNVAAHHVVGDRPFLPEFELAALVDVEVDLPDRDPDVADPALEASLGQRTRALQHAMAEFQIPAYRVVPGPSLSEQLVS